MTRVALNKALFDREGVEIVGVILNKVLPEKKAYIEEFGRRGLARLGIDLLGTIPDVRVLAAPELTQISETIGGHFLHAPGDVRRRVRHVIIGAMSSGHVVDELKPETLVITPGDREDIILAALSTSSLQPANHHYHSHAASGARSKRAAKADDGDGESPGRLVAGIVLAGTLRPHESIMDLIRASDVPVIASPLESFAVASRINSMTVKTLPGDVEKIDKIQALIETHVEVDRLLEKLRG